MKKNIFKMMTLLLALILSVASTPATVFADEIEESGILCFDSGSNMVSGNLEKNGDIDTYKVTIDNSIYTAVWLYAYTSGSGLGSFQVTTKNETGSLGGTAYMTAVTGSAGTPITPKGFLGFSKSKDGIETYTVTVTAHSDNAGYTIILGTKDDMAKCLGGAENAATVGRNTQAFEDIECFGTDNSILGYLSLLNGEGDWYRYTPKTNDATYVANILFQQDSGAFEVYDAETLQRIYSSTGNDKYFLASSHPESTVVQNRLMLSAGKPYFIRSYTLTSLPSDDINATYRLYIGLPSVRTEVINYSSPSSYTVTANKRTTIRINVTGQSNLMRLRQNTGLRFSAGSASLNAYITSCTITAPNGMRFVTKNGSIAHMGKYVNLVDFLNDSNNIPLNGVWEINVLTEKTLTMRFYVSGIAVVLNRNTVP